MIILILFTVFILTLSSCFDSDTEIITKNDVVAIDTANNLMWKKCLEGQKFTKLNCFGSEKYYNFNNAKKQAIKSKYNGYSNWRVPTINELSSIVFCSNNKKNKKITSTCKDNKTKRKYNKPTIDTNIFPKTIADNVWSSTFAKDNKLGWVVNFYSGNAYITKSSYYARLRLVRNMTENYEKKD